MTGLNLTTDNPSAQSLKDKIADAGTEVRQRADEILRSSSEMGREKLKDVADAAKGVASDTADRLQEQAREQQHSGADYIDRVAQNIRSAAQAFEKDTPIAARGINTAADFVEDAGRKLRDGTFRDVLDGATDFAKRQPAAFLGLSVLAGFAAVRFLKASDGGSSTGSRQSQSGVRSEGGYYE